MAFLKEIEHQIVLLMCAPFPNELAYRYNPSESKKLQRLV